MLVGSDIAQFAPGAACRGAIGQLLSALGDLWPLTVQNLTLTPKNERGLARAHGHHVDSAWATGGADRESSRSENILSLRIVPNPDLALPTGLIRRQSKASASDAPRNSGQCPQAA